MPKKTWTEIAKDDAKVLKHHTVNICIDTDVNTQNQVYRELVITILA